jgi:hypothetical protein
MLRFWVAELGLSHINQVWKAEIVESQIALSVESAYYRLKHPVLVLFKINVAASGRITRLIYLCLLDKNISSSLNAVRATRGGESPVQLGLEGTQGVHSIQALCLSTAAKTDDWLRSQNPHPLLNPLLQAASPS